MQISLVQYSPVWEDKTANKIKLKELLRKVYDTDLLIFPEMTLTGFSMKSNLYCEEIPGDSFNFFYSIARDMKCAAAAGIIEKGESGNFYNALVIINKDGSFSARYRKIHPFSYSSENEHYTGGTEPVITEINEWQAGLSICYDLRFPELYRFYGKARTPLIINIANWPDTRINHWNALLKARAIENQCYIAAVNRTGSDPKLIYPGSSVVMDPMGNEILNCGDKEGVFTIELSQELVDQTRLKFPFLDDIKLI